MSWFDLPLKVPPSLRTGFNLLDACWKNEITFFLRLFQAPLHFPWWKIHFRNVGFISLYYLLILSDLAGSQGLPVNPVTLTYSDKALIESRHCSWKRSSRKGEGEVFDNDKRVLHLTRYLHHYWEEVDFVSDHSSSLSSNQVTRRHWNLKESALSDSTTNLRVTLKADFLLELEKIQGVNAPLSHMHKNISILKTIYFPQIECFPNPLD